MLQGIVFTALLSLFSLYCMFSCVVAILNSDNTWSRCLYDQTPFCRWGNTPKVPIVCPKRQSELMLVSSWFSCPASIGVAEMRWAYAAKSYEHAHAVENDFKACMSWMSMQTTGFRGDNSALGDAQFVSKSLRKENIISSFNVFDISLQFHLLVSPDFKVM